MSRDLRTINYTSKNIREFHQGDTIYLKKHKNGFDYIILCSFEKFERGIVTAKVIESENEHAPLEYREAGNIITAKLVSCYLWGRTEQDIEAGYTNDTCCWFKKDGFAK